MFGGSAIDGRHQKEGVLPKSAAFLHTQLTLPNSQQ
jgi:hypothetical protein